MGLRVGLVGERADLALEVASVASRAQAQLVPVTRGSGGPRVPPLDPWPTRGTAPPPQPEAALDVLLVDVAVMADEHVGGRPADPGSHGPPSEVPTVVICRTGEVEPSRAAATRLGCHHVVELPAGASWLAGALSPRQASGVLGVVGAAGGVGTTTAAIACAAGSGEDCLLVDADPSSAGLDVPLGVPEGAGARWAGIPDSDDPLDPGSLWASLPRIGPVTLVTGPKDASGAAGAPRPLARRISGVLDAGRAEFRRTVVDLGRGGEGLGLLGPRDTVAIVVSATARGVMAGRLVRSQLPTQRVVVLLSPAGWLPAGEAAERLEVPAALEVPRLRRVQELADCGDLLSGRTGRRLRRFGQRVWQVAA